jgi:predicted nucleic acid-binding protein
MTIELPENLETALLAQANARGLTPDLYMPDRMIAAIAMYLRVPVISRDSRIRASNVHTIW